MPFKLDLSTPARAVYVVDENGAFSALSALGGTQYAVDAAAGGSNLGTLALLVRDDALTTLTPVDGDYTQGRTNARGALWVAIEDGAGNQTATFPPKISVTTNRPANTSPYTAHDAIADNTAAGSITQMFFSTAGLGPVITKIRVKKSNVSVTALIRVHFFDAVVTSTAGDNAPYTQSGTNSIGSYVVDVSDIGIDNTIGVADVNIPIGAASVIYVKLEAEEGFVPASAEAFTVAIWTGVGSGGGSTSALLQAVDELEGLSTALGTKLDQLLGDVESPVPTAVVGDPNTFRYIHTVLAADGAQTNYRLLDCPAGSRLIITQCGAKLSSDVTATNVNVRVGLAAATLPAAALAGVAGMVLSGKFSLTSVPGEKNVGAPTLAIGTDDQDLRLTCDAPTGGDLRIEYSGYFRSP